MNYLFISGLQRSGTTALANFLNSQENITVYRDFLVFLLRVPLNSLELERPLSEREKNLFISNAKAEATSAGLTSFMIRPEKINTVIDFYCQTLDLIANEKGKIVGHKITESLDILKKFLGYKSIFGIYIIRDIRDVLLSSKNRFFNYNAATVIIKWKKDLKALIKLEKSLKQNLLIIKYEDFIQKKINDDLSNFLNIKLNWNIETLRDQNKKDWIGNTSFSKYYKTELKGLHIKSLFKWKDFIDTDSDLLFGEFICKKFLKNYDYELSNSKLSLNQKIRFYFKYFNRLILFKLYNFSKKII